MSEPLVVRKEVIVTEDGRTVILYSLVRAAEADKSSMNSDEGRRPEDGDMHSSSVFRPPSTVML